MLAMSGERCALKDEEFGMLDLICGVSGSGGRSNVSCISYVKNTCFFTFEPTDSQENKTTFGPINQLLNSI